MESPYGATPGGSAPGGPPSSNYAADTLKVPAIFLIIIGAIGILAALWGIIQSATGMNDATMAQLMSDPNLPPMVKQMVGTSQSFGAVSNVIVLLTSAFVIYGALQMMRLQNFGMAMGSAIVAMIPCFGPCCCLGIPVGIWALVLLNKPEIKASFR